MGDVMKHRHNPYILKASEMGETDDRAVWWKPYCKQSPQKHLTPVQEVWKASFQTAKNWRGSEQNLR